jgi:hypothetical protein
MSTGRLGAGDTAIQPTILDAKGDLIVATAADTPARLAVGSANQTLLADSAQSTGIKWGSSPQSLMTATGDLLYASSANTPARLAIGSTNQVLTVSGGVPTWAALPASGKVLQVVQATYSTATTIASTTLTDSGLSASITPSSTSSKILIFTNQVAYSSANGRVAPGVRGIIMRGSTNIADLKTYGTRWVGQVNTGAITEGAISLPITQIYLDSPSTTSSTTYKTQFAVETTTNSAQVVMQIDSALSTMILMEIGA